MIVGVYIERSIDMLVGVLGILKAGGAYLPLDPNYPAERIAYMLGNANVRYSSHNRILKHNCPTYRHSGYASIPTGHVSPPSRTMRHKAAPAHIIWHT